MHWSVVVTDIGIRYGLLGPHVTFCPAWAGGTVSAGYAYRAIRDG